MKDKLKKSIKNHWKKTLSHLELSRLTCDLKYQIRIIL
jgi:hypothetical protein